MNSTAARILMVSLCLGLYLPRAEAAISMSTFLRSLHQQLAESFTQQGERYKAGTEEAGKRELKRAPIQAPVLPVIETRPPAS